MSITARHQRIAASLAVVAAATWLAGCGSASAPSSSTADAPRAEAPDSATGIDPGAATGSTAHAPGRSSPTATATRNRDVVRTTTIVLAVADPMSAGEEVSRIATGEAGYVQSSSSGACWPAPAVAQAEPGARTGPTPYPEQRGTGTYGTSGQCLRPSTDREAVTVVIRVPAARYAATVAELRGLGDVAALSTSAEDVTAATVDLAAREKSLTASVERLRKLMGKAESVSEVVAIEQELSARESDREAIQAQRRSMADAVAMATITASLLTPDAASTSVPEPAAWWEAPAAVFAGSWRAIVVVVAAVAPFLLLAGAASLLFLMWHRRRNARALRIPAPDEGSVRSDTERSQ